MCLHALVKDTSESKALILEGREFHSLPVEGFLIEFSSGSTQVQITTVWSSSADTTNIWGASEYVMEVCRANIVETSMGQLDCDMCLFACMIAAIQVYRNIKAFKVIYKNWFVALTTAIVIWNTAAEVTGGETTHVSLWKHKGCF